MKKKFIDIEFIIIIFSVYAAIQLTSNLTVINWFFTELIRLIICCGVGLLVIVILKSIFKSKKTK